MNAIAAGCLDKDGPGGASGREPLACGVWSTRRRRRRSLIEGAAAVLMGALAAVGWAMVGALDERRTRLEREWAQLAPSMAEYARLEQAAESMRAREREVQQRTQHYVALLSLLEALSREAHAGVTVSQLQLRTDDIELHLNAVDSLSAAAWAERLPPIAGAKPAEIGDLKLIATTSGGEARRPVEAVVRFRWSDAEQSSPLRRTAHGQRGRAPRAGERSDG